MVLTVSFALSPVIGLCCHRRLADTSAKLDASVEASRPHDFAVRACAARLAAPPRPSRPAPDVRDDRDTPLMWDGTGSLYSCFYRLGKRKIHGEGARHGNYLD